MYPCSVVESFTQIGKQPDRNPDILHPRTTQETEKR